METLGYTGIRFHSNTCAANNAFMVFNLGVTQVSIGSTGVCDATVLQDVVKVGGSAASGFFGRERLHGGEYQGQTVCHVFVRGTGQSWCVACTRSNGVKGCYFATVTQKCNYSCFYLPHLQP